MLLRNLTKKNFTTRGFIDIEKLKNKVIKNKIKEIKLT